jgi:hypothetical protein
MEWIGKAYKKGKKKIQCDKQVLNPSSLTLKSSTLPWDHMDAGFEISYIIDTRYWVSVHFILKLVMPFENIYFIHHLKCIPT